jgi:predicted transcriptional regulator of viral defense system
MTYQRFKNKVKHLPFLLSKDLMRMERIPQLMSNQLNRWQAKGLVVKLRRGIYLLNVHDRAFTPNRAFLANHLYAPSYVSLEYALYFYGLIPEAVFTVTSLATKKTAHFSTPEGEFSYQHIKPAAFRGFRVTKDDKGLSYFMAEPEKAVADFLYFNFRKMFADRIERYRDSYRFQNTSQLAMHKIIGYARLYGNRLTNEAAKEFCVFMREERRKWLKR